MEDVKSEVLETECLSSSGVYKVPFTFIIILQLFIGGFVFVIVNLWFFNQISLALTGQQFYVADPINPWIIWLLLPLNIYGNIFLFAFSIILSSAGMFKILNKLHPPKEGSFVRGSKDWKYMHRRYWVAFFPIWLARALPLPWADIVCYRFFGVRVGKNVVAYEGYIDPLFVDIGDYTMTSLHICIFSHMIYHDKVIIKKVKIGKNCILGPQTIVSPGTVMQEGAILGANSYTWFDQELGEYLIHVGTPVNFSFPIQSVEESQKKAEEKKKITVLDDNPKEKTEEDEVKD